MKPLGRGELLHDHITPAVEPSEEPYGHSTSSNKIKGQLSGVAIFVPESITIESIHSRDFQSNPKSHDCHDCDSLVEKTGTGSQNETSSKKSEEDLPRLPSSTSRGALAGEQRRLVGDVWGQIGAMGAVIGPPGEAMEELYSPYHRCAGQANRAVGVL
ncbi:hypothetical protein THAOC_21937 [Thalassiosira oceanica]|uniref:DUF6820 domain-containing protein n=1 Tax=Thalassiosira oceanica TaxID=159749 RepID=K0RY78_THAOC|nr:hypothetical protein THAOC_21937 [Thalassiosira oceanica]|eukprot:EJK57975.1 hypothetical protein THAOC_21937 [Thalassiosira oceanica]